MKKYAVIWLGCLCGLTAFSCNSVNSGKNVKQLQSDKPVSIAMTGYPEQYPVFSVADTTLDFGTIKEGDVVQVDFKFKNTGTKPLIISEASSTCGCTIPDYSKKPVAPGEESILKVVFNSAGKMGQQFKPVWINANTMPSHFTLSISGNVISKERPAKGTLKSLNTAKSGL
ncbi:MAG: DUF1573 domain-containing protein [Chitinophagaceae bacterium]